MLKNARLENCVMGTNWEEVEKGKDNAVERKQKVESDEQHLQYSLVAGEIEQVHSRRIEVSSVPCCNVKFFSSHLNRKFDFRCLWSGSKIEFSTLGKKVTDQCKWRCLSVHSRIYICYTSADYAIESIRISFFFILFLSLSILDHHNVSIIARLVLKQTSIYFECVESCNWGYIFPGFRPESPLTL